MQAGQSSGSAELSQGVNCNIHDFLGAIFVEVFIKDRRACNQTSMERGWRCLVRFESLMAGMTLESTLPRRQK